MAVLLRADPVSAQSSSGRNATAATATSAGQRARHDGRSGQIASVAAMKSAVRAPSGRKSAAIHASATSSAARRRVRSAGGPSAHWLALRVARAMAHANGTTSMPLAAHQSKPPNTRTSAPAPRAAARPARRSVRQRHEGEPPCGPHDRVVPCPERPEGGQQSRPEHARRAARDRLAGLEAQRMAFRDGAGVLEVDVRVVERRPGVPDLREHARDRPLGEEGDRHHDGPVRQGAPLPARDGLRTRGRGRCVRQGGRLGRVPRGHAPTLSRGRRAGSSVRP
jgi:hypothetical protein